MSASNEPIRLYEVGEYAELTARPNPEDLVILPVPPVEALLPLIAKRLGRDLLPEEIEKGRQIAPSIVLTRSEAEKMNAERAEWR